MRVHLEVYVEQDDGTRHAGSADLIDFPSGVTREDRDKLVAQMVGEEAAEMTTVLAGHDHPDIGRFYGNPATDHLN